MFAFTVSHLAGALIQSYLFPQFSDLNGTLLNKGPMQNLQNPIKIGLATYWLKNCFTTYSSVAIGIRKMSLEMFFIIILLY